MQTGNEQEFYTSVVLIGGLTFAGLLVSVVLAFYGVAMWRKVQTKKEINQLYEQKERKNGKAH